MRRLQKYVVLHNSEHLLFCIYFIYLWLTPEKIIEYVKQSKGWASPETASDGGENVMMNVTLEELYNMPTAEFVHRRAFVNRQLTIYHVAVHACAELKNKEVCLFFDALELYGFVEVHILSDILAH